MDLATRNATRQDLFAQLVAELATHPNVGTNVLPYYRNMRFSAYQIG
jgi:hypothetical protein